MTKKRIISLIMGIALLVPIFLNITPSVHASSNEGYYSVIENYALDCGYSSLKESDQKKCKGLLYDLDGDGQNELIVQYLKKRSTAYSIWTMENGTPVCALDDPFCTGSEVEMYVTEYNGKSFFVLSSWSAGSDGDYFEWLFYDITNIPYQLAYNLGKASNYDGSGSSRDIVNKTGDGSTYAQVYTSLENKKEILFDSTAKTFDFFLEDINQGNAIKDEHPYISIVRDTLEYTKSVYSWSDGYGILYDVDSNGIEELIMVYSANTVYNETDVVPATVYSVYTMSGNVAVPLVEQEVLCIDVGGPTGYVAIAEKDSKKCIVTTSENGEVGPIAYRGGNWMVMSVHGTSISKETEISYEEVYSYEENTVLYDKSYAVINGTQCDYHTLKAWVDEINVLVSIDPYAIEQNSNVMTLLELLDYLRTLPAVEDTRVLCAYATNVDLTVSLGEEMKVSYAMFINGEHTETWDKPALAIANDDIISVTQCEKNNIGYAVMIKGKRAGATHLTVTDGDSGASVTIYITVRDTYATPLSYIIDDVPSFTPEISFAKNVQTNIWDCYGLYVNDFPGANEIQKVDGNYLLEFNVYNESSMYGSIDVYDKNNNWIRSYPIEKYTGIQGMYDTLEGLQYLVKDAFSGNLLNYTSDSQSAYTRAKICVPEGGHFTLSNNYLQSPGAYLYNSIDIIFTGANLTSDVMGFFDGIVSEITTDAALRAEFAKIFVEEFSSVALNLSTDFALGDYGVIAQFCSDNFFEIMTRLKIDFWGLAESYFNMAEEVLKEFLPAFIEHPLETIFTIQKFTDAICQLDDIKDSPNQSYIIMYTPEAGKGVTTMNGVTVIPDEGVFADNAVLQVFRISDSGNIVASDSGFVVDQYELYHICYTVDNNKVQPNGNVTIKIPIPATFNRDSCDVYHQQPDGSWEIVNTRIEGEFIVFEVDHFSLFAVVNSSGDNDITQNNASEDEDQENSDGMGIPIGVIGVVVGMLFVVVAVVIMKKKRR